MKKLTRIWILTAALLALLCGAVCAAEDDVLIAHSRQTYLASVPMPDADEALLQQAEAAIVAGFRDRSNPVEHNGKTYYRTAFFESPFAWPGDFTDEYCGQLFNLFCRTLFDHPQEGYDIFTEVWYLRSGDGKIAMEFLHVTDGTQDAAFDAAVDDAVLDCFGPYWDQMTDLEKAALCYSYVVGKVTYSEDYVANTAEPFTPYGALMNGKAVCQGYTQLYKLLLDAVDFDGDSCIVTTGKANGNHAWNLVKLDNVWYHVDPTWGDGYGMPGVVLWDYFLRSDDEIRAQNHTEWNVTDAGHACLQSFAGNAFWKYQEDGTEKTIRSPLFVASSWICYATDYDMWYSEAGTDFSDAKNESTYFRINGFISGTAACGAVFYADVTGNVYMYLPLYGSNTKIEEASGLTGWVYMDSDGETLHLYTQNGNSDAVWAKDVAVTETTDRDQPVRFVRNRFITPDFADGNPVYIRTAPAQTYYLGLATYDANGQMIDWSIWAEPFTGNALYIPGKLPDACTEVRYFALDIEGRPLSGSLPVQRTPVTPQAAA